MIADGATVRASDPVAIERARVLLDGAEFVEDPYEVARGADALLVLTEWKEREASYVQRRHRILEQLGHVPAYATLTREGIPATPGAVSEKREPVGPASTA